MSETEQRAAVIAAARGWLGTKFHDGAQIKGVGVDCANLLAAVFHEAGLVASPIIIEPYSPQFFLHRDEPLFENYVRRYAHEVEESKVGPGDIVLYKIGRSFAHGAIIVCWPAAVIHAFKGFGLVAETPAWESNLRGREVKFFSAW